MGRRVRNTPSKNSLNLHNSCTPLNPELEYSQSTIINGIAKHTRTNTHILRGLFRVGGYPSADRHIPLCRRHRCTVGMVGISSSGVRRLLNLKISDIVTFVPGPPLNNATGVKQSLVLCRKRLEETCPVPILQPKPTLDHIYKAPNETPCAVVLCF